MSQKNTVKKFHFLSFSLFAMFCIRPILHFFKSRKIHKSILWPNSNLKSSFWYKGRKLCSIAKWKKLRSLKMHTAYEWRKFHQSKLHHEIFLNIYIVGLLIYTLISENQGLIQTLEKFQVLQTWIFFFSLSPEFFSYL